MVQENGDRAVMVQEEIEKKKPLTKEEKLLEELKKIAKNEGNKHCADCCD